MAFSKRIVIERYPNAEELKCAGLISGETESGEHWILFLDAEGKPEVYWPQRDPESGAVEGDSISLKNPYDTIRATLKTAPGEEMVATFPVWTPEVWPRPDNPDPTDYTGLSRGVVFCIAPEGQNPAEAMRAFVDNLSEFYEAEERTSGK